MKNIPLTQGKFALVDDDDFEDLAQYKWRAVKDYNTYYARRNTSNSKRIIIMHRQIMDAKPGTQIDHKNNNGLDNQRSNLRFCTNSQNHQNQKPREGETSKYKGVYWDKSQWKWRAYIKINGKCKHLCSRDSEIDCAKIYDAAAIKYFGEFAKTNLSEITERVI